MTGRTLPAIGRRPNSPRRWATTHQQVQRDVARTSLAPTETSRITNGLAVSDTVCERDPSRSPATYSEELAR